MRAAIIGVGSLGTIIGALITKSGKQIDLIDSNKAHVDALNETGATITGALELTVPVHADTPDNLKGYYDLVFLLTKQTVNQEILTKLRPCLHAQSVVCTLQNGIPEYAVADIIGAARTIGGAVGFGATWIKPGVSALTSSYEVTKNFAFEIGEMDGAMRPRLELVQDYLSAVGKTEICTDLMGIRFSKLLMNATFSGMSAALGCTFGEVLENPRAMTCLAFIADECIKVAHAQGVRLAVMQGNDLEVFELNNAADISSKLPIYQKIWGEHTKLKASMLQDLEKKRDTEIAYINGLVCDKGLEQGVPTPFNSKVVELVSEAQARRGVNDFSYLSRFDALLATHAPGLS